MFRVVCLSLLILCSSDFVAKACARELDVEYGALGQLDKNTRSARNETEAEPEPETEPSTNVDPFPEDESESEPEPETEPSTEGSPTSGSSGKRKPNLLFIVCDQLRYDALEFVQKQMPDYRNAEQIRTPNIDRLARRGTVFETAYWYENVRNVSFDATGLYWTEP